MINAALPPPLPPPAPMAAAAAAAARGMGVAAAAQRAFGAAAAEEEEGWDGGEEDYEEEGEGWQARKAAKREEERQRELEEEEAHWPCPLFAPRHRQKPEQQPQENGGHSAAALEALTEYSAAEHQPLAVGDTIAYKLVKLDDSWQPIVSEWIVGVVLSAVTNGGDGGGEMAVAVRVDEDNDEQPMPLSSLLQLRVVSRAADGEGDKANGHAEAPAADAAATEQGGAAATTEDLSKQKAEALQRIISSYSPTPPSQPASSPEPPQPPPQRGLRVISHDYSPSTSALNQLHFYFSDSNLQRDGFMREKINEDDGWVSLELLLTFNRMRRMGLEVGRVAEVVRAGSKELEIDEAGRKVRRKAAYQG